MKKYCTKRRQGNLKIISLVLTCHCKLSGFLRTRIKNMFAHFFQNQLIYPGNNKSQLLNTIACLVISIFKRAFFFNEVPQKKIGWCLYRRNPPQSQSRSWICNALHMTFLCFPKSAYKGKKDFEKIPNGTKILKVLKRDSVSVQPRRNKSFICTQTKIIWSQNELKEKNRGNLKCVFDVISLK